jgi:hypothetical protein
LLRLFRWVWGFDGVLEPVFSVGWKLSEGVGMLETPKVIKNHGNVLPWNHTGK